MQSRYQKGRQSEALAAQFLEQHGLRVVARNVRCPLGEIDVVAEQGRQLVFVEVKSRFGGRYGLPQEAVSIVKQRKLTRLAQWYLKKHGCGRRAARFDVIAITWKLEEPEITWIVNAFEARE